MSRWRNCSTAASSATQFYLGLFFGWRGRENQRQLTPTILSLRKLPQWVECFDWAEPKSTRLFTSHENHQCGLGDSEDESDAKIFSVPDSETGQQSASHIQLEMPRQLRQGNAERFLVENYCPNVGVTWRSKVFRSISNICNVQVYIY